MLRSLAVFAFALGLSHAALADVTVHYREGQRVDPTEVRRILEQDAATSQRTRSIRLLPVATEAASPAPVEPEAPSALSLPVRFDFDSATILPAAREQLDALAEGIKMLPPERSVVIEGHTDGTGTAEYNEQLSRRRAAAVKQYLVARHGIDAQRLHDEGFGKRHPIEGTSPNAPENRRVQFRGS
jgi:outer membrane protein OmpA-like peptidoglycan-associated protein